MTVLMHDVRQDYTTTVGPLPHLHSATDILTDLEYADDTLLFARTAETLNTLLHLVEKHSKYFGMQLNKDKTLLIVMNPTKERNPKTRPKTDPVIYYSDHTPVPHRAQVTYLGVEVHETSAPQPNLAKRLAHALSEFNKLHVFWNHANLTKDWKLRVFKATFYPMILYALHHTFLSIKSRRTLDAWQARQLRRVLGIKAAYYSRTANTLVIKQAKTHLLSDIVDTRQKQYLGHILRAENNNTITTVCIDRSYNYRTLSSAKREGHPRSHWLPQAVKLVHDSTYNRHPPHLPHLNKGNPTQFPCALFCWAKDRQIWRSLSALPTLREGETNFTPHDEL